MLKHYFMIHIHYDTSSPHLKKLIWNISMKLRFNHKVSTYHGDWFFQILLIEADKEVLVYSNNINYFILW